MNISGFLNEKFFRSTDAYPISCFRFLFCFSLAAVLLAQMPFYLGIYGSSHYYPLAALRFIFGSQQPSYWVYAGAFSFSILSLVLAAFGIFPRVFLLSAALSYFLFTAIAYAFLYIGRRYVPPLYVLLILTVSPGVNALSFPELLRGTRDSRKVPSWPMEFIALIIMLVYFISGCSKLIAEPVHWLDGKIIQNILLGSYLEGNHRFPMEILVNHPLPSMLLSILTVIFELGFVSAFFIPRLTKYFIAFSLCFHIGIALWINVAFLTPVLWCAYFVFLDYNAVASFLNKWAR
jgi:hypothetical protein